MMAAPELDGVDYDGGTFEHEGVTYRVRVVPDEGSPMDILNGYDSDGRVAWVDRDRWEGRDKPRPEGFDGRAVKIDLRDGAVWWQPCEGAVYDTRADFERDRSRIRDLLEYGYSGVIVERLETVKDSHGGTHEVVSGSASLWSVDLAGSDDARAHVRDVVAELIYEITPD